MELGRFSVSNRLISYCRKTWNFAITYPRDAPRKTSEGKWALVVTRERLTAVARP